MKILILFALFVLVGCSQSARAQDAPRAELFGGYSYLRVSPGSVLEGAGGSGFTTSLAGNLTRNFGLVAEFSRHSRSLDFSDVINQPGAGAGGIRLRALTYLFGPRLTLRGGNLEPFAHALFGAANGRVEAIGIGIGERASGTAFTFALGGGLDLKVRKTLAIRVGQLDYLRTRTSDLGLNSVRYSTGLVFRLGTR
jgi:opacity protein-like surface antigen